MKKVWNIIGSVMICLLAVIAVCMMIFTVISVTTFDRNDRSIFGYKLYVVLSDSMSATDFKAGDLIFVKETDPRTLEADDIIAYISQDPDNYGATVTHKIRRAASDAEGNPGFITYGTNTGIDDPLVVTWPYILGQYRMRLPGVGTFFSFLRTVPGYLLFILLPFLVLILFQGVNCVRRFREYRAEQMADIMAERELLREERAANERMLRELEDMRQQIENIASEGELPEEMTEYLLRGSEDADRR